MRNIISFMHISLDGFVAGPRGEMDWIKVDEEIFDLVGKRVMSCDTALYGRTTFQMMEGYWPTAGQQPNASKHDIEHSEWYSKVRKVVLSTTLPDTRRAQIIRGNIPERLQSLKQQVGSEILLFGSPAATHSLIAQNLIDGYWLFLNPVVLGTGIRLFEKVPAKTPLQLVSQHQFTNGVIELRYLACN